MKCKYKYTGKFQDVIVELLRVSIVLGIIIAILLIFGMKGNSKINNYSILNIGVITYISISFLLWLNWILNILIIIRHVANNIEKIEIKEDSYKSESNFKDLKGLRD